MKKILAACLLVVFSLPFASAFHPDAEEEQAIELRSMLLQRQEKELNVLLEITGEFDYSISELDNPPRMYLEITPVHAIKTKPLTSVKGYGVDTIRTAQYRPFVARVVFDFSEKSPFYLINRVPEGILVTCWSRMGQPAEAAPTEAVAGIPPRVEEKDLAPEHPESAEPIPIAEMPDLLVGISFLHYTLADERYEEVFDSRDGADLGLELSFVFLQKGRFRLAAAGEIRNFKKAGRSTISGTETELSITPMAASLRALLSAGPLTPYVGAGLSLHSYSETSSLMDTSGSAAGINIQAGLFFEIPRVDFLKLRAFFKWSRVSTIENEIEVQLGGTEYGVGLSFGFNF